MEWISELGAFLWAVVNNWAGYTTGGVVVALLWLWSTLKQVPISRKVGIVVASIFLFFAVFNAWREQHNALVELQKRLDTLTVPKFSGDIGYSVAPGGKDNQDSLVTIQGIIKNEGAPSIIGDWSSELSLGDGRKF